jgi:hypothetical protein
MPRTVILHIGLPKTGSSAIQGFCAKNRKMLLERGVFYPPTPAAAAHVLLASAALFRASPEKWPAGTLRDGLPLAEWFARFWAEFDADMRALPATTHTIVLSAEQFSFQQDTPLRIAQLRDALAPYCDDMKVVPYLRRQDRHAISAYSQLLRFGIIEAPRLGQHARYTALYDYPALLQRWGGVFGKAALAPRIFERGSLRNDDVVQDFLGVCGVPDVVPPPQGTRSRNPSINLEGQALLLAIGAELQQQTGELLVGGTLWTRLTSIVAETCAGLGWQPSRSQARTFMAHYEAGNEAVRLDWFPERPTLFDMAFDDLPVEPVTLPAEPPAALMYAVILQALRRGLGGATPLADHARGEAPAHERGDKPLRRLQAALGMNPNNVRARLGLARHLAAAGEPAAALLHARAALALRPAKAEARALVEELEAAVAAAAEQGESMMSATDFADLAGLRPAMLQAE